MVHHLVVHGTWCLRKSALTVHVCIDHALWKVVSREDCLMQQVLHLDLHCQDELSAVEEFPEGGLRVEFLGNNDVDLLGNLLELANLVILHQPVSGRTSQGVGVVGGCDGKGVLIVLENEPDDVVDNVDRLVNLVPLEQVIDGLVEDVHSSLG